MEASRVMTREVVVVPPEMSLPAAHRLMQRHRVRHLLVVSGGSLVGILSDRDVLLRASLADDGAVVVPLGPVAAAMTMKPILCEVDASVASIAALMIERRLDAVPIVSAGDSLVGLVTSTDLLALLADRAPTERLPFEFRQLREHAEEARDA